MKTVTIKKGRHRASGPFAAFNEDFGRMPDGVSVYKTSAKVAFLDSCVHDLQCDDQWDWSKLFGFQFGVLGVHRNSYRFGWRYNPKTLKVEVCKLVYTDRGRTHIMEKLADVEINALHEYEIEVDVSLGRLIFRIDGVMPEEGYNAIDTPLCCLRFGNGFYFGGNRKAPHDMSIMIERGGGE